MLALFLVAAALVLRAAAQDNLPPLQTLNIPVTVDDNLRYGVQVNMSTGAQAQSFMFALSTGTGYSVVASSSCTSCEGVKGYDASASSSSLVSPNTQNVTVANVNAKGNLVRENCSLRQVNGSAWAYPNQTVVVANESQSMFTPGISGIFGLGTNGRDGNFSETVFGGWMRRNPLRKNFTYGMALNHRKNSSSDGGVLHWIAPDPTYYSGDVTWSKISPFTRTDAVNTDWFVPWDGWDFTGNGRFKISHGEKGLKAFLDPWLPLLVFPQKDARLIYGGVQGAIITTTSLVNVYSLPCSTKMNLTLTFGSFSASLDESHLIQRNGDQCTGLLQEWASPSATEFLLGSTFIATIYLIFSVSSSENGSLGFAARATAEAAKRITTVSIIGISLGSAAFAIVVISVIVFVVLRRKRKAKKRNMQQIVTPFPAPLRSPNDTVGLLVPGNRSPQTSPDWGVTTFPDIPSPSFYPAAVASSPMIDPRHPMYYGGYAGSVPPSYHPGTYVVHNPTTPSSPEISPNSSPNPNPANLESVYIQPPPPGKKKKEKMDATA